ncbi:MAG: sigma-70 family RNA polymerase sigma factor [Acidimicrobiales bacterium]
MEDNRQRFETIVDLVYEPLQRFARRRAPSDVADDVVADTLLVIWRRLDEVPTDAPLPWTYRVAANCLANLRRGERRRARLIDKVGRWERRRDDGVEEPPDPGLHQALLTLAPSDQEVLRLWAWEDLTPAEIATVLDTSANAVSIRLHRAKRRLGVALGKVPAAAGHIGHDNSEEVT